MTRSVKRGKTQRDNVLDKKLGTGAFRRINKDRRSKQLKHKTTTQPKENSNG